MEDSVVKRFLEYKPPVPPSQDAMQYQQGQRLQSQSPLHHYRLPNDKAQRPGGMACSPSPAASISGTSEPGLQYQARPPSGPKAKFTLEDDALLIELKEKHELTWKKISEFFPGRSSGTLQVRYCTKLKAKGVTWTDDMVGELQVVLLTLNRSLTWPQVGRLRHAMHEYESEKWRIISSKVGHGFSAAACQQKAEEMDLLG
ncbi:MAG: hypothetical protein HETSPECPRED_001270 [Heterodermia speciosa]|uniref:Myb-like domain-containing protein n=1 Tax=Heterodermia speciosa TaxID=116794 RepID=A0A8H3I2V7_9LECA|nr:MAG: hypothetical protein HETSPECPRED_001270 [Heterodermia speciosa]